MASSSRLREGMVSLTVGEFEAWTATDGSLSNVAGMGDEGEAGGQRQVTGTF